MWQLVRLVKSLTSQLMTPFFLHYNSPPEEKIALFRTLFRGREDVYPRRASLHMPLLPVFVFFGPLVRI